MKINFIYGIVKEKEERIRKGQHWLLIQTHLLSGSLQLLLKLC